VVQLEIEVPESAFSALRVSPAEFGEAMQLAAAVKWYEVGMISQSKAASVAGVSREEFLQAAGRFKVSAVQTTSEGLMEELARD
jgi:predicted HTH domain antitoxin